MRPFSFIASLFYGLAVNIRNFLFDRGLLKSYAVGVSTVCVGNVAVGGTGKTPHTEYIARELSKRYQVAILSRGYKRKTRGFRLAQPADTALEIGDEPLQMYRNLKNIPVAVSENRIEGVRRLKELLPDLQVVVLDDAFQHRKIKCDFYILITEQDNLYVNDHFLPYGRLRDRRSSSLRANAIIVSKCKEDILPIDRRIIETSLHLPSYQQLYFSKINYAALVGMKGDRETVLGAADIHKPLLLTAIANPESLLQHLQKQYKQVVSLNFPDHHSFTRRDIERVRAVMKTNRCDSIITTEKDVVRLEQNKYFTADLQCVTFVQPITISFIGQRKGLIAEIEKNIKNNHK